MKKWIVVIVLAVVGFSVWFLYFADDGVQLNPISEVVRRELPYEKYSFERMVERKDGVSEIVKEELMEEFDDYSSYLFSFVSEGKRITGQLNVPDGVGPFPVVVMLRGYVDPESYVTGVGTKNAAGYFANKGFLTVAPDFLGYGGSDDPDEDTIGARVRRPATVLDLIVSLDNLTEADTSQLFMWGHSNGGQIALSVLEVLGKRGVVIPTTLWAPVSKPFPYSILYYTDEYDDRGKAIRKVIANFEKDYDVDLFSIDMYFNWLNSPLQIHQGTADDAVPSEWSDEFVELLNEMEKDVDYYVYSGADHNMRPVWDTVVARDLRFYRDN